MRDLDRGDLGDLGDGVKLDCSEVVNEKIEASEELQGDAEFAMLKSGDKFEEEVTNCGEYGVGEKACEALGEVSGDFRLIKEGDVIFLNSKIAGD